MSKKLSGAPHISKKLTCAARRNDSKGGLVVKASFMYII